MHILARFVNARDAVAPSPSVSASARVSSMSLSLKLSPIRTLHHLVDRMHRFHLLYLHFRSLLPAVPSGYSPGVQYSSVLIL